MGLMTRAFILIIMVACLTSVANAIAGQATFYTPPYIPSSCYGNQDRGVMIMAANSGLFNNRGACGNRYRVSCTGRTNLGVLQPCTGRTVDVTVVDLCPGCASNQIDLSQEAFAVIANPDAGRINIDYNRI
ncbi:EG45-like domain containing protein [Bidens hawaiensis]|uniref:EG45-like domain containing protein n=1 Tax=Bidens hawaiensis TaxID=980011 RepID=UPI00404AE2C1